MQKFTRKTTVATATAVTATALLLVPSLMIAASAEESTGPLPQQTASASPATIETPQGDATASESGTPSGGKISTDDPDISEGFSMEPTRPTLELFGSFNGNVYSGSVYVDATAASGPLEHLVVQMELTLLLADGSTFGAMSLPVQLRDLGIDNTQSIPLNFDISEQLALWETPGQTVRRNGGDVLIASISKVVKLSIHPSYHDGTDITGFDGPKANLTRG